MNEEKAGNFGVACTLFMEAATAFHEVLSLLPILDSMCCSDAWNDRKVCTLEADPRKVVLLMNNIEEFASKARLLRERAAGMPAYQPSAPALFELPDSKVEDSEIPPPRKHSADPHTGGKAPPPGIGPNRDRPPSRYIHIALLMEVVMRQTFCSSPRADRVVALFQRWRYS